MEYKQPSIEEEIRRRIADGIYMELLPTSLELAEEFGVNVKTVNKVLKKLTQSGLLERKRRSGTRVNRNPVNNQLIEVIFEGFTTIFSHPFWGEIWTGMVDKLSLAGYRPVLNMLESDSMTGLLKLDHFSMTPSIGKIVLGIEEKRLLDQVAATGTPFIAGCDQIDDPAIPQVAFDFGNGIGKAVDFLYGQDCRRIAFIGQTQSYIGNAALHKFNMYRQAIQKYTQIDPLLIENIRPTAGSEIAGMKSLLNRTTPDALIAAYDHQLFGILAVLDQQNLTIPVIGCDGLDLPGIPLERHCVSVPRRKCGELLAQNLIADLQTNTPPKTTILPAAFK